MLPATSAPAPILRHPALDAVAVQLVSVIIPVIGRVDDLAALHHAVVAELEGTPFELLFLFDGGAPAIPTALRDAARADERVRLFRFDQSFGEATVLRAGFERSRGNRILTMSAYFQVRPEGIQDVLRTLEHGADVVVTRRWPRHDGWLNRLQSRVFHSILRGIAGVPFRDMACGLRGMRREVTNVIPLYGDLHRFIPALAAREGFRVSEIDVPQHEADTRRRVYGIGIYLRRVLDVLTYFFLAKFTEKPLRFFGLVGATLAATGTVISATLFVQRLAGQGIANRPLLLLGVLLLAIGLQVIGLGLVGEIIVHLRAPHRRSYRIGEIL